MGEFQACPNCQAEEGKKVSWTLWGGAIGPRMFNHVKCGHCGAGYNGKTGKSNTVPILIYTAVSLVLAFALLGGSLYYKFNN